MAENPALKSSFTAASADDLGSMIDATASGGLSKDASSLSSASLTSSALAKTISEVFLGICRRDTMPILFCVMSAATIDTEAPCNTTIPLTLLIMAPPISVNSLLSSHARPVIFPLIVKLSAWTLAPASQKIARTWPCENVVLESVTVEFLTTKPCNEFFSKKHRLMATGPFSTQMP